jgi:hypothetical protein
MDCFIATIAERYRNVYKDILANIAIFVITMPAFNVLAVDAIYYHIIQ